MPYRTEKTFFCRADRTQKPTIYLKCGGFRVAEPTLPALNLMALSLRVNSH